MKKLIILAAAAAILAVAMPAQAKKTPAPDYMLRCQNGKYAKVWLAPFKVDNKCGDHDKQWVEVYIQYGDEDVYVYNVAGGAKFAPGWSVDTRDNHPEWNPAKAYVVLGRGLFCLADNYAWVDINGITTTYRPGSTWRAPCPDYPS